MAQYFSTSWMAGSRSAAYYAALSLVAIQVGIGIIMKSSQTGGQYSFSASASVTISEFLKLLLSGLFFWRECRKRQTSFHSAPTDIESPSSSRSSSSSSEPINQDEQDNEKTIIYTRLTLRAYLEFCKNELSTSTRYGFAQLALLYALINNSIFVAYKLSDPGTISLTRSGVTFITALVMICAVPGTRISKIQWIAILFQICGLITSQYRAEVGISYPLTTYLVLLFQVFLSALAGVYNQSLLKGEDASLHAGNMMLYGSGVFVNLLLHITIKSLKDDEPGFFSGYNSIAAILVIASNVFIGLAITAVYKYADAVIKCLATAVATGILLYVSPLIFGTEMNPLILPGAIVVLGSSWLYVESAIPKDVQSPSNSSSKKSILGSLAALTRNYRNIFLILATGATVLIVALLELSKSSLPDIHPIDNEILPTHGVPEVGEPFLETPKKNLESPFKNTLGFVRWNSEAPESMPLLRNYAPFFHDLHFSMPNYIKDEELDAKYHNITHDSYEDPSTIYMQLSRTMQLILDSPESDIDGLLYFHFDAWIDPLHFTHEQFRKIWMPQSLNANGGGPSFICTMDKTTEPKYPEWWPLDHKHHRQSQIFEALDVLKRFDLGYVFDPKEYCTGWSDFYYIPKRYFADYIFLSSFFGGFAEDQKTAIPTMIHIIDQTRRAHVHQTILSRPGDCWSGRGSENADMEAVMTHRCGQKIDYDAKDTSIIDAHFDRLAEEVRMLDKPIPQSVWASRQGALGSDERKELFDTTFKEVLQAINHWDSENDDDDEDGETLPENPTGEVSISEQEFGEAAKEMENVVDSLFSNLVKGAPKPGDDVYV